MNINYYNKYLKYKHKYVKLKMKIENTIKPQNEDREKFENDFIKDLHTNIMKLEFMHDLKSKKVRDKTFYDLLKQNVITIENNIPEDREEYLQELIMNRHHNDLKKSLLDDKTIVTNTPSFSDYGMVFDNLTFRSTNIKKLQKLFGVTDYYETFIGNCEKFIKSPNATLSLTFLNDGELKSEFLHRAVLIGFLPKSKNSLLAFAPYNDYTEYNLAFEKQLKLLLKFCNEVNECKNKLKFIEIQLKFLNEILEMKDKLECLINTKTIKEKGVYYEEIKKIVERVIFSMKEARDSSYIDEMLTIKKNGEKPMFITTDRILTFRCILNKIPVINILNGIIRYIADYRGNKLRIIGNPFELFDDSINPNPQTEAIIRKILRSPVLQIVNNYKN